MLYSVFSSSFGGIQPAAGKVETGVIMQNYTSILCTVMWCDVQRIYYNIVMLVHIVVLFYSYVLRNPDSVYTLRFLSGFLTIKHYALHSSISVIFVSLCDMVNNKTKLR